MLFVCVNNSCRSQMAEGFLRVLAPERFEVSSAGSIPTSVNPFACEVMKEVGVDISSQGSNSMEEYTDREFDYVITVCGGEGDNACPAFPGEAGKRLHWGLADPASASGTTEDILRFFRTVRDSIKDRVEQFIGARSDI